MRTRRCSREGETLPQGRRVTAPVKAKHCSDERRDAPPVKAGHCSNDGKTLLQRQREAAPVLTSWWCSGDDETLLYAAKARRCFSEKVGGGGGVVCGIETILFEILRCS